MILSRMTRYYVLSKTIPLRTERDFLATDYNKLDRFQKIIYSNYLQKKYSLIFQRIMKDVKDEFRLSVNFYTCRKQEIVFAKRCFINQCLKHYNDKVNKLYEFHVYSTFLVNIVGQTHASIIHNYENYIMLENELKPDKKFIKINKLVTERFNQLIKE
jgi:hypothetical protein